MKNIGDESVKKIIVKSCIGCNYHKDMDDPPSYCSYSDKEFDIPDEERQKLNPDFIWEGCELEDYPDYNTEFHNWLEKHFPHIKKEWDIFNLKDV